VEEFNELIREVDFDMDAPLPPDKDDFEKNVRELMRFV